MSVQSAGANWPLLLSVGDRVRGEMRGSHASTTGGSEGRGMLACLVVLGNRGEGALCMSCLFFPVPDAAHARGLLCGLRVADRGQTRRAMRRLRLAEHSAFHLLLGQSGMHTRAAAVRGRGSVAANAQASVCPEAHETACIAGAPAGRAAAAV